MAEKPLPAGTLRCADDDLGDVFLLGETQDFVNEIAALDAPGFCTKPLRQPKQLFDPGLVAGIFIRLVGLFQRDDQPAGIHPRREIAGGAHHFFRERIRADTDKQPLTRAPRSFNGILFEVIDHLVIDPVGGASRKASSRSAVRLPRRKKLSVARRALSGR